MGWAGEAMATEFDFTQDWFSSSRSLWRRLLAPMAGAPNLRFAEVGVYEGRATVWLLLNVLTHRSARIDCIDPFAWRASDGRPVQADMRAVKRRFHANIEASGSAYKVRLIEARSDVALCALALSSYDCIYVDGSHRAADVLSDAVLFFRLLKPNGLLIFDDYRLARSRGHRPSSADPRIGIEAFLAAYARRLDLVWRGYQLAIRRRG
jgi:predicted O-methyltransferase YrrM